MLFNMYRYIILRFFLLMIRLPPRSTRTDTLFPYTTLFRSVHASGPDLDWMEQQIRGSTPKRLLDIGCGGGHVAYRMAPHAAEVIASDLSSEMIAAVVREAAQRDIGNIAKIGRAHV